MPRLLSFADRPMDSWIPLLPSSSSPPSVAAFFHPHQALESESATCFNIFSDIEIANAVVIDPELRNTQAYFPGEAHILALELSQR